MSDKIRPIISMAWILTLNPGESEYFDRSGVLLVFNILW
jgi:hypothetical protein